MSLKDIRLSSPEDPRASDKVVINVGGIRHETYTGTLKNIPDTRLYWITENKTQLPEYDPNTNEYFFDRHPSVFAQILNFYRTGKLHCPNDVCGPLFEEELAFWGIDELQVESCCWLNYKKHREAQANLDTLDGGHESDRDSLSDMDMTVYGLVADSIRNRNRSLWKKYQPKIWTTFEEPYSSRLAQIIAFTTLMLILTSVITFCLESDPYFEDKNSPQFKALYITDIICVAWFTLEFVVRLIFCPKKFQFIKKPMNWIDFGAIVPFYLNLFISESDIKTIVVLRVVRLIRVFRIFKLSRHSYGLQILGHTLKSSCSELFLLAFFLSIGVVIFSSIIYYAEKDIPLTKFTTIPASFWWAVVTMTTLGYGDMTPESWEGKIVGSFCAISGVLMIALPVPVIVSNFSLYYSHAKARLKLPKRKRPLIIGAANALKVAQSFVTQTSPNLSREVVDQVEGEGQDDSDKEDVRRGSRTRRSPHPSFRSTHRGSPLARPKLQGPSTLVTPPSPRNSGLVMSRLSLLAAPEAERIEIEMDERNPSYTVVVEKEGSSNSVKESESQQSSPSGSKSSAQASEVSSTGALLSPKKSEPESATSEIRAMPEGRQRSTSSAKSVSVDSSQGSPKLNPRGRMGRRGSLYVVGFTAKHWQNKALKKNKTAQTDPGSRKASTVSATERRGSSTYGVGTNGARKGSSINTEKASQLVSQLTALQRAENTSDNQDKGAENGLRGKSDRSETDGRNETSTQTPERSTGQATDKTRFMASSVNPGRPRDAYRNAKTNLTSVSIESNDSSSRMSDDSLSINDRHRQRRGSSPLVRQKAVFTFDTSDQLVQVDPCAGRQASSGAKGRSHDDNGFSLSPLIEQSNEMSGENELVVSKKQTEIRRNSCIPAIATERKSSGKKTKSLGFLPNGYINGSYRHDEEDRIISERGLSPSCHSSGISSDKPLFLDPRRRSETYPVYLTVEGEPYPSTVLSSHGAPYYTEAKTLGQYSAPPHIQLTSNSDLNLPSISEEHVALNSKPRGVGINRLQMPAVLPRPNSLPNWSGDLFRPVVMHRPYSDSLYMNHSGAYPFPANIEHISRSSTGNIQHPLGFQQYLSTGVNQSNSRGLPVRRNTYSSFEEQRALSEADVNGVLAQRRQGHVMYVHAPQTEHKTGDPSFPNERDRIPEVSRKDKSRSKGSSCEHVASPFCFQKTESISSPDLHSINGSLAADPLYSNLSSSWYQSPDDSSRKRTIEDSKTDEQRNFGNISDSGQEPLASKVPIPNSVQNNFPVHTSEQIVNDSIHVRSSSGGPSPGRTEGHEDGRGKNASSPRLERTDRQVIYNGHEVVQPRESLNRPAGVPVFNRQRARAIFVGDSGIDSVNSSTNSMTHSLESDGDASKERKESVTAHLSNARVDILNPIDESETEVSESISLDNARNSEIIPSQPANDVLNIKKQVVLSKVKINGSRLSDILSSSDLYESSLV